MKIRTKSGMFEVALDRFFNPAAEVYRVYLDQREERERSLRHYPSSLCAKKGSEFMGKCRRAIVYEMKQTPPTNPIEAVALFKFDQGNMVHDKMDELIDTVLGVYYPGSVWNDPEKGYGKELEVKWKERGLLYEMSGRLDKRFQWQGLDIGSEWKSIYGRGVTDIKSNGPKEDALLQVISYLRQPKYKLDAYILSYIAKDSGYIYSFVFWYEDKQLMMGWLNNGAVSVVQWGWRHIKPCLVEIEEAMEMDMLPARDYSAKVKDGVYTERGSSWRCNYCKYRNLCWEVKDA